MGFVMRFGIVLWMFCMGLCVSPVQAQPYDSHWQAALQASSQRMRLFALMSARPTGAAEMVGALQRAQGFAHRRFHGPQIVSADIRLAPVLEFDNNINGGTPGTTILVGGLPFGIPLEQRATQGMIWGAKLQGNVRSSMAPRTIIDAHLSATMAQGQGLTIQTATVHLCLGQFLGGADWLDMCVQRDLADRALSHSDQTTTSIAFSQQFATDFALSEAQVILRHSVLQDYQKLSLDFGLTTARAQWGVLETRAEFGQFISGQHTRLFAATLALKRPIFGADTTLFAAYSHEGGANFFGTPRWDDLVGFGMSRPINDIFGLSLSLQNRDSTLANYRGITLGLDFTFSGLTF